MTDFQKALAELQAADLSFLAPPRNVPAEKNRRKPRSHAKAAHASASTKHSVESVPKKATVAEPPAPVAEPDAVVHPRPFPTTEPVLPVFVPPAKPTTVADANVTVSSAPADPMEAPKKRNRPVHEWPPVGTQLVAEYFGTKYHAEIVAARKKLKSGKQIRLLDGPGQGKRLDSFSKAALVATARQRRANRLGRKGMSSGWSFWAIFPSTAA